MPDTAANTGDPAEPVRVPQHISLELGRLDLATLPLGAVLARVAELAKATVSGADEVSVTLIDGESARSVAFTGDLAVDLDERQYVRGFGPCMDAALCGEVIHITDMELDDRYRDFSAVAARAGVLSSLSVGMPVPERVVGGLNFYSSSPDAFDQNAVDLARVFADYGAVALVNAALIDSKTTLATDMQRAMASRASIEQAKGILMERLGHGPDQAFAELVRRSQHANRKLTHIAADLIVEARSTSSGS